MKDVTIDYDKKTNRFVIASPPWYVGHMRSIPNRRFDPRRRV